MHQALYRKYRPRKFSDVVGQEHITHVLTHQAESGKINHAYLFAGSRGTGKTSCAKILARAANCTDLQNGDPCGVCPSCVLILENRTPDVLEMDAASNTGVDYIRDIKTESAFAPVSVATKVYIIDEAHMLTDSAFNALLKTLEEPPAGVIFILATTEIHKVPATILSRCQRFSFRRLHSSVIAARLAYMCEQEGISAHPEALDEVARLAAGGMRDAESLLELCASGGNLDSADSVTTAAGAIGMSVAARIVRAVCTGDCATIFTEIAAVHNESKDISSLWASLLAYYRNLLAAKTLTNIDSDKLRRELLDISDSAYAELREICELVTAESIMSHLLILEDTAAKSVGKSAVEKRHMAELALVRMSGSRTSAGENGHSAPNIHSSEPVGAKKIAPVGADLVSARPIAENKKIIEPASTIPIPQTETQEIPSTRTSFAPKVQDTPQKASGAALDGALVAKILASYKAHEVSTHCFLETAMWAREGNKIHVTLADPFAKMMLISKDAIMLLEKIIETHTGETLQVELMA